MKSTDDQGLIPVIVASEADTTYIRTIPTVQPTAGDGSVSLELGLPPECAIAVAAGGKRPQEKDMNGIWNLFSRAIQALQACRGVYDATFATAIGGYPEYALVSDSSGNFWVSTADSNTTVPGADDADWQSLFTGLQTALGFTPVQQGGGTDQNDEKVYIGNASDIFGILRYRVGTVDMGPLVSGNYGAVPANGDVPIYAQYWSTSGRPMVGFGKTGDVIRWQPVATYADAQAVQTNLTSFQTSQTTQNSTFSSEIAARVPTNATNDGTNAPITLFNYYLGAGIPFIIADGVTSHLVQTNPGTGWNQIKNISVENDNGALTVLDTTGTTNTYAPCSADIQSDTVSVTKVGDLVIQTFEASISNANNGGAGSVVVQLPQALTEAILFTSGNALGGTQGATDWIPSVNVFPTSLTEVTIYADNLQNLNWTQAVTVKVLVVGS